MNPGTSSLLPLFAAAAILVGPAAARALDPGSLAKRLLAPRMTPTVAVVDKGDDARRQREIYRILCGGAGRLDGSVSDHLWNVAESLAREGWEPPKVTIRVVVSDPGRS